MSEVRQIVRFAYESKLGKFYEGLKENKLMVTRCTKCKKLYMPPRADCSKCKSSEMEWVELSGRGKLATYTAMETAPQTFEKDAPFIIGIVELEEGPRIMARLRNVKREDVKVGMELRMHVEKWYEGQLVYMFEPPVG